MKIFYGNIRRENRKRIIYNLIIKLFVSEYQKLQYLLIMHFMRTKKKHFSIVKVRDQ